MTFNTNRSVSVALVIVLTAASAACASRPKPEPAQVAQVTQQAPTQQAPQTNNTAPSVTTTQPPPLSPSGANVPGSMQDFVVNVGDRVYFETDQYDLSPAAQNLLNAQAGWLQRYPGVQIRIEGNADERGTREYNFALGSRRAESVRDYLVARGVSASRIETVSYGKERPIDPASSETAWSKNRNGHTAITGGAR